MSVFSSGAISPQFGFIQKWLSVLAFSLKAIILSLGFFKVIIVWIGSVNGPKKEKKDWFVQ